MCKNNTACSYGCKGPSVHNCSCSYGCGSIVSGTTNNRCSFCQASKGCCLCGKLSGNLWRFIYLCKKGLVYAKLRKNFIAPLALGNVKKLHTGCIAYFRCKFACEHVAHIVFWKQDVGTLFVKLRLVLLNPENL